MTRYLRSLALPVATAVVLSGCSAITGQPMAQMANDTTTTATLKTRLATMEGLGSLRAVGIRTQNDMVYLTGTVADEAQRARIEAVARRVAGDNRVVNELRLPGQPATATAEGTTEIR
jgi:osmotically-inducible protein OsmY